MLMELEHIKKSYGRRQVLTDVSMKAEAGTCVGIIGSNGCGKSTLLSILAGVLRPDGGSLRYEGRDPWEKKKYFAAYTAFVPQENPLIEELSVRDNLALWYAGTKRSMEEDLKNGIPADLGVSEFLNRRVSKLSGGMKKKVSICAAMANHAPILIMDEPGAALDINGKEEMKNYIADFAKKGGTVILASHEDRELRVCDVLYGLRDGVLTRLPASSDLDQVIRAYFQV